MGAPYSPAGSIAKLISEGHRKKALKQARTIDRIHGTPLDAHFYFQYLIVAPASYRQRLIQKMRDSKGYSSIMEGDLRRDLLVSKIASGVDRDVFVNELHCIKQLHIEDDNRLALLRMVCGRYSFMEHDYTQAYLYHDQADVMWLELKSDADQQWQLNNRFHLLRAAAALGMPKGKLYEEYLRDESNSKRLFQAKLFNNLFVGKRVALFGRWLERMLG